ncbi:hypothetical protein LCGC14_0259210 [marine sediment metagenome]|uniref:Uncharacterized protein n=1 Tax=marine sediment metagenome TaxID=412755 RepID=A0A0F9WMW7_9ZZZZ
MGREIRMVPRGWEHPKNRAGGYRSLFNSTYKAAAQEWWDCAEAYHARDLERLRELDVYMGADPEEAFAEHPWYWEWTDRPPNPEHYRPEFDSPADHFQVYENTTEGTPISPVLETKGDVGQWLMGNWGYSEEEAFAICETGWTAKGRRL